MSRRASGAAPPSPRIFICYRREDTSGHAGRLSDALVERFGRDNVFMDIDTIRPGQDFVEAIEAAVPSIDVLIAVIGPGWLSEADGGQMRRRIDDPRDYVRLEIAEALRRKKTVIPTLVRNARMPTEDDLPDDVSTLATRQAIELRDTRWIDDVQQLIDAVQSSKRDLPEVERPRGEPMSPTTAVKAMADRGRPTPSRTRNRRRLGWILASSLAVVTAVSIAMVLWPETEGGNGAAPSTGPGTSTGSSADPGDEATLLGIEFASGQSYAYRATRTHPQGAADTATLDINDDGAAEAGSPSVRVSETGFINSEGLPRSSWWFVAPVSDQVIDIDPGGGLDQTVWLGVDQARGYWNWWLDQYIPILPTDPLSPGDEWSSEGFTSIPEATGGISWTATCTFVGWETVENARAAYVTCRFAQSWDYSYSFARIAELGGGPTQDLGSSNPAAREQATATYELRAWLDAEERELIRSEGDMQVDVVTSYSGIPSSWDWSDEEEYSDTWTQVVERID